MRGFRTDYKTYEDEALMRLFTKGDTRAFEEIYDRYEKFILNFFYKRLWSDRIKAEDFTHDLFTKIIDNPGSFDLNRSFKTWLFSVANNMCKNEYKKQAVRKPTSYDLPEGVDARDHNDLQDKAVDKTNFNAALKMELDKLNDKHREVFLLRHFEGLSLNEIGEMLAINTGTVKSRLHHATKALAEKLEVFRKTIV
jgi:RNA polymerase sigma-70 factor (ECF subfamily)